jgi:hypothetical protein
MNPYSQIDSATLGYLSQAGITPGPEQAAPTQMGYPTYPNAAGVGSQTAGVTPPAAPQQSQQAPQKNEIPDATARGMSPYSLIGDANYRDKDQQ